MRHHARVAPLLVALGVAAWLAPGALAETLVFRDPARGKAPGKILAEFEDLLFVALDGEAARFVARAELEAIIDQAGTRYDAPAPGTFARLAGATPRGAVTDPVGAVLVGRDGREPTDEGEGAAFLFAADVVVTGDGGLCRLMLTTGTTAKLAPSTEVTLPGGASGDRLDLLAGEVFVETALRPLELILREDAALRVGGASRVGCELQLDGARHVLLHEGTAELVWADLRVVLAPGLGAELVAAGDGRWRVTADVANHDDLELRLAATTERLAPGASKVYGATAEVEELWRLVRARGELLVRRGAGGALAPLVGQQRERLALAAGDVLAVGADAEAILGRVDGAQARLAAGARLEVAAHGGPDLRLEAGRVVIEASESPVTIDTPGGPCSIHMGTVAITRLERQEVEAVAVAGAPALPLGAAAALNLSAGAVARVRRLIEPDRVEVELTGGRATISSRAHGRGPDPRFKLPLAPGQRVAVAEGPVESSLGAEGVVELLPTLLLPGGRALAFQGGDLRADVLLDPSWEVVFERGGRVRLTEGLWLGLATVQGRPELRFKAGPRVRLTHPATLEVHNPRLEVIGAGGATTADIELHGEVDVRVEAPTDTAAIVLGTRDEDRFEVPRDGKVQVDREGDLLRLAHGDGRRLWLQDGAPPVQARLADQQGTLYVTMPGAAPLGLAPGRPVTVMATRQGELVILSDDQLRLDSEGLELLTGAPGPRVTDSIARDRARELLDVPPPDSPSGP